MRLVLFVSAIALTTPAAAQFVSFSGRPVQELESSWTIGDAAVPEGVLQLGSKDLVLKQPLLPRGLVALGRSVTRAEAGVDLPAGTHLAEVRSTAGTVFCDPIVKPQKMLGARKQLCLLDANNDNVFESAFTLISSTPALLMVSGRMPRKRLPLASPIPYEKLDPTQSRLGAFVAIERRNYFNIYARENFQILYGTDFAQERITAPIGFKSADMPKEVQIMGARFTAMSEANGKLAVKVHSTMPAQPFAVVQTISYR